MTISPMKALSAADFQGVIDAQEPTFATRTPHTDLQKKKAAQEFEAVFVRKILVQMEKGTHFGAAGAVSSGNDLYGSMAVGALSDTIARAGGLGLSDMIVRALSIGDHAENSTSPAAPAPLAEAKVKTSG